MSRVPKFPMVHPWATTAENDDSIAIRHAERAVVFRGPGAKNLLPAVIAALDGTRLASAIVSGFPASHQAAVYDALERLADHRLLVEAEGIRIGDRSSATTRGAAALSEALAGAVTMAEIVQRLGRVHVHLLSDLENAPLLAGLLRSSGFGAVELAPLEAVSTLSQELTNDSIVVLAPRRNSAPELITMNAIALLAGCSWTHILPFDGFYATIGPLYLPGETGCYECFQIRRRSTLETIDQQRIIDKSPESVFASPLAEWTSPGQEGASWGVFTHLLSIEALGIEWAPSPLAGHIHTMQWAAGGVQVERHRLFRVPRCPSCGPMDLGVPQPWFEETFVEATPDPQGGRS